MKDHTCATCGKSLDPNNAGIWYDRTKQFFCDGRCLRAYLLVDCPWCFAKAGNECRKRGTHPTRVRRAADHVKKLTATPIETLIERSSLGTPHAKRLREKASPKTVERVLLRADQIEKKS